jgi:deoxycytidylate deaminase
MQCAKLISNSGITKVVCRWRKQDSHRDPAMVLEYLEKCMIELTVIKDPDVN